METLSLPPRVALSLALAAVLTHTSFAAESPDAEAKAILGTSGVKGGLVVHVGSGDGQLTAALRQSDSYLVQGLDPDAKQVAKARESLRDKGVYGNVTVDVLDGKDLPYIDGLVNLVVADDLRGVPMQEVMRVLVPNGVACIKKSGKWTATVKPRSTAIDEWTHYFYDAKGNAISHDATVAPPERLQWVGSPRWSRHHDRMSSLSAEVTSGGRLFYIMDEGSRISILLPSKWTLTARDAFNGVVLWRKPIEKWHDQMWPLKSGPTQLARRLVSIGDKIYVTLGIEAPVSRLDAATGEPTKVYDSTKGAEEILYSDGILYVMVNKNVWQLTEYAPKLNTGDQKRVETEYNWDQKPRELQAVDAATGNVLWKREGKIAPVTMATDGKRLIYYNGDDLVCIDSKTGKDLWQSPPEPKRKLFEYNYAPRLVLYKDVVLYAGGDGTMKGLTADTGKELWTAPHSKSGYRSPEDLMVANGLVWNAPTTSGNMSGAFAGRDPFTGELKVEFPPDVDTYWFHHRCYIAKGTDRFLLPSRTGIEFVDISTKHWDINHWVRGACLYGVIPANGLVYAGPHNCACYPEAKLDGMNALAPASASPPPKLLSDEQRLQRGPAYSEPVTETEPDSKDWPTYRHDNARSGYTSQSLAEDLGKAWELNLGGRLSAPVIAAGKVFVSEIDEHVLNALDATTGKPVWHFIVGGRVDSPPTYWKGRVLFGGMDGNVYCVRASDGALIWRFQAAPANRRHSAFEQVESVWPVHGSVLVENGVASLVAGRSVFLDGGLRFIRLDAATGKKLVEQIYDDKNPETGNDLQELVKTLQMPVGSNDILSSDGKYIYLRSQKIDTDGKRIDIAPVSGNAVVQGGTQTGPGAHIFAPMGFLDDTWFHRSYWVYGKHFAGGHSGYYQAGKYTPSGRILVFDDKNVYGYGREPQYYKWTTTMAHQLFAASKEAPNVTPDAASAEGGAKKKAAAKGKPAAGKAAPPKGVVRFSDSDKLDPSNKALTVEAWVMPDGPDGVVVTHGGGVTGYALALQDGKPGFSVRANKESATAEAARPLDPGWHHLAGVLTDDKKLRVYVDGQLAAETKAPALLSKKPNQGLQLGGAGASLVSDYGRGAHYTGLLDQFVVFPKALSEAEIADHAAQANGVTRGNGAMVAASFDNGDARDESGNNIQGVLFGVETGKGKVGAAMWFRKPGDEPAAVAAPGNPAGPGGKNGFFVQHQWTQSSPVVTRAMAMAGTTVFIAGPPDNLDEEYAFERLTKKDSAIQAELAEQDASLDGKRGGTLCAVSVTDGNLREDVQLESPPVWDGMAIAQGRIYVASMDGKIRCFGQEKKEK